MKKLTTLFFAVLLFASNTTNIYAACTPAATAPPIDGGFFPAANNQPCAVREDSLSGFVIHLKNFGYVSSDVYVISTRIDTIIDLPSGLSWSMTAPTPNPEKTLLTGEIGCIEITGATNAATGIHQLDFAVTVVVSLDGGQTSNTITDRTSALVDIFNAQFGAEADFSYFVNVVNSQSECTHTVGIKELTQISGLNIYPNPLNNKAIVSFYNAESAEYMARITDIMGKEVYAETLHVETGLNTFEINRNNISSGVYFFVLSSGKATTTRRLIVE